MRKASQEPRDGPGGDRGNGLRALCTCSGERSGTVARGNRILLLGGALCTCPEARRSARSRPAPRGTCSGVKGFAAPPPPAGPAGVAAGPLLLLFSSAIFALLPPGWEKDHFRAAGPEAAVGAVSSAIFETGIFPSSPLSPGNITAATLETKVLPQRVKET